MKTNYDFYIESEDMLAQALTNAFFAGYRMAGKEYSEEQMKQIYDAYAYALRLPVGDYAGVVG